MAPQRPGSTSDPYFDPLRVSIFLLIKINIFLKINIKPIPISCEPLACIVIRKVLLRLIFFLLFLVYYYTWKERFEGSEEGQKR